MLTMKKKQDIMWSLTRLTSNELKLLKDKVSYVKADLNKKFYFTEDTTIEKISGSVLENLLEIKRIGKNRSFIIFKNNEVNYERLKFIEKIMDVVMN